MPPARGLHAHVLDTLGQRIVDGALEPGTVVRPELVADEFGVSRSVVREALRVLQSLGLVEPRQRVGTQVLGIGSWELLAPTVIRWRGASPAYFVQQRELLELRLGVEPVAASLTAGGPGRPPSSTPRRTCSPPARARTAAPTSRPTSASTAPCSPGRATPSSRTSPAPSRRCCAPAPRSRATPSRAGRARPPSGTRPSGARWSRDDGAAAAAATTALVGVTRDEFIAEAPAG